MLYLFIDLAEENKLIIFLDDKDMDSLDITYKNISWENEKFRVVLAKLLTVAQSKLHFSIKNRNLSIKILDMFNGCVILFSLTSRRSNSDLSTNKQSTILHLDSAENLMLLCEKSIDCWSEILSSTLFLLSNTYFILIYHKNNFSPKFKAILQEYGETFNADRVNISYLNENGKILCKDDAIEHIGNCIIKTDAY